ncbi:unnamed protein product [Didymodactylos carnosus]|uniref:Uncharacterized protein n=1 Tax=Didymodactylos carnosus TaxID=1234261 RepID=A0A815XDD8_9BILA|nr:unnamed protein product [Didymodactylos carnosus]CAF1556250.1 unnamed protein product [Didymodactylos carnosus]CAF3722971.1 unnamed protein product [Didymodactylos carnosus]CAF4417377.1 unnamed protein product [Didymodactylos carnosus]
MITQSYQWTWPTVNCDQSMISGHQITSTFFGSGGTGGYLVCSTSSCGNYSSLSIQEYCTDYSATLKSMSGSVSSIESLTADSQFCVTFSSSAWIAVQSTNCGSSGKRRKRALCGIPFHPACTTTTHHTTTYHTTTRRSTVAATTVPSCTSTDASWTVTACIDLTLRPDGYINTPPVATIISR